VIRPRLYPVISLTGGPFRPTPGTVAIFFTWSDAVSFINAELPERNLYLGAEREDRRATGYRWRERADLEPKELPNGRFQVAA